MTTGEFLRKVARYVFSRKTMVFAEYQLSCQADASIATVEDAFRFRQLTLDDLEDYAILLSKQATVESTFTPSFAMEDVEKRLGDGEMCFICEYKGSIIAYAWFSPVDKFLVEVGAQLRLSVGEIYAYNAYVAQEYRGKNVIPRLLRSARTHFMAIGIRREILARMVWNRSASQTIKKLGFRCIGKVTTGYCLGILYFINTCRGVSLVPHSGPFEAYARAFSLMSRKFTS